MLHPAQHRLVRAILASAATGAAIYFLVMHVLLPGVAERLTQPQIDILRQAFAEHPALVIGGTVGLSALLALPVLGVFRWVYGPLRGEWTARARR
jgi:hypothetical protein